MGPNFYPLANTKKDLNDYSLKHNNLSKKIQTSDILKNINLNSNKYRRQLIQNRNDKTLKKNPFVTIRNTVINFNMFDSGVHLSSIRKKLNDKNNKYKLIRPYETQSHIPNKNSAKVNPNIYCQKTFTNSLINKNSALNNTTLRPIFANRTIENNYSNNNSLLVTNKELLYLRTRRLKPKLLASNTNRVSAISSFNKLVNKIKYNQFINKKNYKSLDKNNNIFKSIKLNELYLESLRLKKERKIFENKNGKNNAVNANMYNNRYRIINFNKNNTLPLLTLQNQNK